MPHLQTVFAAVLLCGAAHAQNMIRGEYWIDQDLGFGANNSFALAQQPDVASIQLPISLNGFSPGVHTIGIRTIDASGHWSLTNFSTAVVTTEPEPPLLTRVEYFLDQDPGFGEGTEVWSGTGTDAPGIGSLPDVSALAPGSHTLFVRTIDSAGHWSLTVHAPIVITAPDVASDIVRVEVFNLTTGSDPGFGSAAALTVTEPQINLVEAALWSDDPLSIAQGNTLAVRSMDSNGKWSLTNFFSADVVHTNVADLFTQTGITTYPNPFSEGITVRSEDGQPLRVVLYDPQGKLVHDKVLNGETYIDLGQHASGTYTAFFWKELERIHRVQLVKH